MSAELVDPFATPKRTVWSDQALDEMAEAIRARMVWGLRNDPDLVEDVARKALHEIRNAPDQAWAGGVLEQLWHRAESGVRYTWDEDPREPAWSLDPERRLPR